MTKDALIEELISEQALKSPNIIQAFHKVDRADFVPAGLLAQAYENYPLPIGLGQTISQPYTVAFMLELLEPKAGEKILEIGAGSGWQTALLAYLVGSQGRIFGIERVKELKTLAEKNLSRYPVLQRTSTLMHGDGSLGHPQESPFDKIIAAAAGQTIPPAWKAQLKAGGRIVAPVKDSIVVIDKISENQFKETEHYGFAFVPLIKD